LIFDVDGTLADTEEVHRQAFNATFGRFGLAWDWTPALYARLLRVSGGRERITHYAREVDPALAARPDFATFVRNLHREKTACYAELLQRGQVRLRCGVERLLHEARGQGLALGIATSSAWSNLKTLLDGNLPGEWPTWFSAIETCDSVSLKKPAPAVYLAVLRRLGLPPAHCVALEDTENGLKAACAADLTTVITAHEFTRGDCFDGAAAVLDGLGDPEHPSTVVHGPACPQRFVDLRYLAQLVERREAAAGWEQGRMSFA